MKRALVIAMMASVIFAGSVQAQSAEPKLPWINVATSNEDTVSYVNVESIKDIGGGIMHAWVLQNQIKPETSSSGVIYLSSKIKRKFNCIEESTAMVAVVRYSETNALGSVVSSVEGKSHEIEWRSVVPETVGEALLKFVCAYK